MATKIYSATPLFMTSWPNKRSPLAVIRAALSTRRQRRALGNLDDSALFDLGLTRAQVEKEAARPVWDVPAGWRR